MKTSKQDKLIAGQGITIASDGKTISSGSSYRYIDGNDAVYSAFISFLHTASDGDELYLYAFNQTCKFRTYDSPIVRFVKNSGEYVEIGFTGPIQCFGSSPDNLGIRFVSNGHVKYYKSYNDYDKRNGVIDMIVDGNYITVYAFEPSNPQSIPIYAESVGGQIERQSFDTWNVCARVNYT